MIKRLNPIQLIDLYHAQIICDDHELALSCITMIRVYDTCAVVEYEKSYVKEIKFDKHCEFVSWEPGYYVMDLNLQYGDIWYFKNLEKAKLELARLKAGLEKYI